MSTTDEPKLWTRLVAALRGEVRAETLEAYRRAGVGAYELLDRAELRRAELTIEQADPWSTDPATKAFLLCAWNAFTLQLLGDEFLDADYRANPSTAGFVPPVTATQALAFFGQVEGWLSRANQAASNPAYRLDVYVPAELPGWAEAEPCPREHLERCCRPAGGCVGALRWRSASWRRPRGRTGLRRWGSCASGWRW